MKALRRIALAACTAALPAVAPAQPALPGEVDLAAVLRLAREASPRAEIERVGVARAEAERIGAAAYPNPTLNYARTRPAGGNPLFEGSRQQDAGIELPLLIAGQRSARVERAEREIEAARARVASGLGSLAAEAGAGFIALLAAQEKVSLLSAAAAEAARVREIVAGRERGGAASRYDLARVELELAGISAKLDDARAEQAERAGALAALLGLREWQPRALGVLRPYPVPPRAGGGAPEDTPAAVAAAREEEAARSGIEVARRERWPVPAISLGRTWTSEPFGASNAVGLSVEIPLLDTRRGPLARAEAEARAAGLRRQLVTAEAAASMRRLEAVIAARQAALERFERDAAGQLAPLRQMAEDAYRLGRSSVLELLDAARTRHEVGQVRVDLTAGLAEAQVRLLALLGELDHAAQAR